MKLFLFDLGGVLIELKGLPFRKEWHSHNESDPDFLWINSSSAKMFESGEISPTEFGFSLCRELSLNVGSKEFLDYFRSWPGTWFPEVKELLSLVKSRFKTACLSNSNELHWERARSEWGVEEVFDYTFASHEIGKVKPDAEIFIHVIKETGYAPENIIFFDDNEMNIDAAERLGIESHHVRGGGKLADALRKHDLLSGFIHV